MTDYTITTNFGAKDSLPSGNAGKVIKGEEFTTEFTNLQTAVNTKADTAGDTFTGAVNFDAVVTNNAAVTVNSTATITGDLTVDTNTLFVDVSENRVGIGTVSPDSILDVVGADPILTIRDTSTSGADAHATLRLAESDTSGDVNMRYDIALDAGNLTFDYNNGATTSERMRIDSLGNVGVGTESPSFKLDVAGNARASYFALRSNETAPSESAFIYRPSTGVLGFGTNTTERMRIDSTGNVGIGTTHINATGGGFSFRAGSVHYMNIAHGSSVGHGNYFVAFKHDDTVVGTITKTNTTGVSYNTSSDERLKENITDSTDAGSKVDAIQIRQFDWKADGSHQDYGVIAQELATVAPEAVHQPEDSEDMMGVDYSKLVPMLIKEVQSLRSRVAELENV